MTEAQLQKNIVTWCKSGLRSGVMFWATSNERKAKPQHMKALKQMGVLSGVADLIILSIEGPLFVELKKPTTYKTGKSGKAIIDSRGGVQSDSQKEFQANVTRLGFEYAIIDTLDDFIELCESIELT